MTLSPNTTCPQCQSKDVRHECRHAILGNRCHGCGHWWSWSHPPLRIDGAMASVVWKGRYGGKTLGEVWAEDQAYVFMLANHEGGTLVRAARMIIAHHAPELFREHVETADDIPW